VEEKVRGEMRGGRTSRTDEARKWEVSSFPRFFFEDSVPVGVKAVDK
jgi:hypothetical protein